MIFKQSNIVKSTETFSSTCVFPVLLLCLSIPVCSGTQDFLAAQVIDHSPCCLAEVDRGMSIAWRTSEHAYAAELNRVRLWIQAVVNECPYSLTLGCSLE